MFTMFFVYDMGRSLKGSSTRDYENMCCFWIWGFSKLALTYFNEPLSLSRSVMVSVVLFNEVDWLTATFDFMRTCSPSFIPAVGIIWAWLGLRGIPRLMAVFLPLPFFFIGMGPGAFRHWADELYGRLGLIRVRLEHELVLALSLGFIMELLPPLAFVCVLYKLVLDEDLS